MFRVYPDVLMRTFSNTLIPIQLRITKKNASAYLVSCRLLFGSFLPGASMVATKTMEPADYKRINWIIVSTSYLLSLNGFVRLGLSPVGMQ